MLPQATLYGRLLPPTMGYESPSENWEWAPSTLRLRRSLFSWHIKVKIVGRWFLPSQNRTSIRRLRSRRTVTENWVSVLRQSWNNSERASGVWSPSLSRQPAGKTDRQHEFGFNCFICFHRSNGGQNPSRREAQSTNHTRSPPPAFCISCAPSVQNTPSPAMRLCRGHRCIAKTSATTGQLQGLSRRSRSPEFCRESVAVISSIAPILWNWPRKVSLVQSPSLSQGNCTHKSQKISASEKLKNSVSRNWFVIGITN